MISLKTLHRVAIGLGALSVLPLGQATQAKPPNVLIVIDEDQNNDSVGVNGSKEVKTPTIAR